MGTLYHVNLRRHSKPLRENHINLVLASVNTGYSARCVSGCSTPVITDCLEVATLWACNSKWKLSKNQN